MKKKSVLGKNYVIIMPTTYIADIWPKVMIGILTYQLLNRTYLFFLIVYNFCGSKVIVSTRQTRLNKLRNDAFNQRSITDHIKTTLLDMSQYCWCIIADFMTLKHNTIVFMLVLSGHQIDIDDSFKS